MPTDFTLPELGENITEGDVVRVLVKVGDVVERDQPVLELETDKATIEVPSSVAGTIRELKVKPGDKVKVGQAILSVDGDAKAAAAEKPAAEKPAAEKRSGGAKTAAPKDEKMPGLQQPTGAEAKTAPASAAQSGASAAAPEDEDEADEDPARTEGGPGPKKVVDINLLWRGGRAAPEPADARGPAPAAPSTRRVARELGVDISQVPGTGPGGRISTEDVQAFAQRGRGAAPGGRPAPQGGHPGLPDFSRWGEIDRQPMRAIRRKTAEHLSEAWATIPHVTQFDKADITDIERLRERFGARAEQAGGKLTVTAIALKVVAAALKQFPQFNASVDMATQEIVYKKYVHVGVAVDTDRGLLVPVIRDVDTKGIVQLSAELAQLAEKARTRQIGLDEMEGGCFTITNLGGIGGTFFTPIVNAPEVAILGISRASMEPVFVDGEFRPRLMLPLSLSYDHRVVDGADGIRFLRWVAEALEQPFVLAL